MRARLILTVVLLALTGLVSWSINFNVFYATIGSSLVVGCLVGLWYVKVRGRQPGEPGTDRQRFINKVSDLIIATSFATLGCFMSALNGAPFQLAQIVLNLCFVYLVWSAVPDTYLNATRREPWIVAASGVLVTLVWQGIFFVLPILGIGHFQ